MSSKIEINPSICHGKPIVKGTRVMVSTVLSALASEDSIEDVLEDYPAINKQDFRELYTCENSWASFSTER